MNNQLLKLKTVPLIPIYSKLPLCKNKLADYKIFFDIILNTLVKLIYSRGKQQWIPKGSDIHR